MAGRRKRKHAAGVPHLFRQRGKKKIWYGLLDGQEVSLGTSDAGAAQRRLLELAAERERAAAAPPQAPLPKLSVLAAKYIEFLVPPRVTKKTAASYGSRVAFFVEWAERRGVVTAADVTFELMSAFVIDRQKSVKARTVNRDVLPVRRMFAFGRRNKLVDVDPFRDEDFKELKLREPQPRPNALTVSPAEVSLMLVSAEKDLPAGYASLLKTLAGSGIRIDEARHLDDTDVQILDDKRAYLHITVKKDWQPKSYRCRTIPVTVATAKAALSFIEVRSSLTLDDKTVWKKVEAVRRPLGLPNFGAHEFRRAWASAMYAAGATLKQVSVWLGHSSVQVTERYIRVFGAESEGHEFLPL